MSLYTRADDSSPPGVVLVAFCYYEAAINQLTNPALDPTAKIPEFKCCAVRASAGGIGPRQNSFGGGGMRPGAPDAAHRSAARRTGTRAGRYKPRQVHRASSLS